MRGKLMPARDGKVLSWVAGLAILAVAWTSKRADAQQTPPPYAAATELIGTTVPDAPNGGIVPVGCSTCGSGGGCGSATLPSEPIYLHADPVRLAQVFSNLLNNSCKYTEPGGRIWLTAERQRSDVVVSVKDNGLGIPADMLPKIFEMFTQVNRSLERSQGGLGIGLTLVKRLVEMHGGSVEARSDGPGKGSEFTVRLPVAMTSASHQP